METGIVETLSEGRYRAHIYLDTLSFGLVNHFAIDFDEFLGYLLGITSGTTYIVYAFEDNQRLHATLPKDITVETLYGRIGKAVAQHAVTANTQIEHAHLTV